MSEDKQFTNSKEYQIKLLAYMLNNHDFCNVAADALKDEVFSDKALSWYFNTIASAPIRLTSSTLKEELVKAAQNSIIRSEETDKYIEYFELIKERPVPVEEQYINDSLGKFVRTQAVKKALLESWDLAKSEQWDDIVNSMQQAVNQGVNVLDMGYFYFQQYENRLANRLSGDYLEKLSTGIPHLDEITYGGLKEKQLGLIVGGTGRGKSIFLEWLAKIAIILGKKVVYYTLELSSEDVSTRFDSLFSQIKINELKLYNNDVFKSLSSMSDKYGSHLVIKEYPADEATVHTLKAHLRTLSSIGFVPDLVIVDYLDLLKPHRTYKSTHEELDAITKALHGMSKELRTRVWTATQLNRAGLVMETPDETSISGAIAKLFTVDLAIFLAQTKEEREDQTLRLLIAKNRNGPAGRTIAIDTDYSRMTFYTSMAANLDDDDGKETPLKDNNESSVPDDLSGVIQDGDVFVLS